MKPITSVDDLKEAILILKAEQEVNEQLLKEQAYATFENLKPVNLIRNTFTELASTPHLVDDILGASLGIVSGYISKKIVLGNSGNLFRRLFGTILQFGVTNIVAQNSNTIKSVGQSIIQHFLNKKVANTKST
jgi:hypothetical protein